MILPLEKTKRNHQHAELSPEAFAVVITGILLALARTSGPEQDVCCVTRPITFRLNFNYGNLHDMSYSVNEPHEVEAVGVAGNTALVCMTVRTSVGKWLHTLSSHPTSR